jgi:hypothetical protein
VCAEASTVLRDVAADFLFSYWYLEIPSDNSIQHIPCASTIMHKTLDWKRSRISVLEVEAVTHSCIYVGRNVMRFDTAELTGSSLSA